MLPITLTALSSNCPLIFIFLELAMYASLTTEDIKHLAQVNENIIRKTSQCQNESDFND